MRSAPRHCSSIISSQLTRGCHQRVQPATLWARPWAAGSKAVFVQSAPAIISRPDRRKFTSCEASPQRESSGSAAREVAKQLIGQFVESNSTVALDSGDLCTAMIQEIGDSLTEGTLKNVSIVAACDSAATEAAFVGVPQAQSADLDAVDVMFSDVDEIDVSDSQLAFVFGRRSEPAQPQIPRFRAVAKKAKAFVALLASEEQAVDRLGRDLPVLLQNDGWEDAAEEIDDIFVGDAEIWRRTADAAPATSPKGDPSPYVSSDGHTIVDIQFYGDFCLVEDTAVPYGKLVQEIMAIPGVLSVGLMEDVATHVVISGRSADQKVATFSKEELQKGAEAADAKLKADLEQEQDS